MERDRERLRRGLLRSAILLPKGTSTDAEQPESDRKRQDQDEKRRKRRISRHRSLPWRAAPVNTGKQLRQRTAPQAADASKEGACKNARAPLKGLSQGGQVKA